MPSDDKNYPDHRTAYTPSGPLPAAEAKQLKARGREVSVDDLPPHLRRALGMQDAPAPSFVDGTHDVERVLGVSFAQRVESETADQTDAAPMDEAAVAKARTLDEDPDKDDDGETDVEHFGLPAGLLADAELTDADSDDPDADFDGVPEVAPAGALDHYGTRPGGGS